MRFLHRLLPHGWILVLLAACAVVIAFDRQRAERVGRLTQLGREAGAPAAAGGPGMIVPGRHEASFHWMMQTRRMLADGRLRLHRVDYDNALGGRETGTSSPYRSWLGTVAWLQHLRTGRPAAEEVETVALVADPLLHVLLLIGATVFVAWRFGGGGAALTATGLAALFPLGGDFFPGAPDDRGLIAGCALASILTLVAGMRDPARPARLWFVLAGVAGGLALWVDVRAEMPLLTGLALGGCLAAALGRRELNLPSLAAGWRAWSAAGAGAVFAAYLLEYWPALPVGWRLDRLHPLYGVAWIGIGELVARMTTACDSGRRPRTVRTVVTLSLAAAAAASLPVAMILAKDWGFLSSDVYFAQLSTQPDSPIVASLLAWLKRDGVTPVFGTVVAPLALLVPAGGWLFRRATPPATRAALALALGPAAVALGFACAHLCWWTRLDAALIALAVAAVGAMRTGGWGRWIWTAAAAGVAALGLIQLRPATNARGEVELTRAEAEQVILRHLAHWLDQHAGAGGAVVFAPPAETTPLVYFGQLRGIGTFDPANAAGFGTSLSITGAATMETAQALLQTRQTRYLVIPSWDPYFENFAALYLTERFSNRQSLLAVELRRLHLPPWLRPVAYPMPEVPGFEHENVLVFEVVNEQSPVLATTRLAEYLVETGAVDRVPDLDQQLQRFPADLGALAARIELRLAAGDEAGAAPLLETLQARIAAGGDRYMAWDRRVRLAIVCGQANLLDLARRETERCLAEVKADRLRALTPGSLFGLLVLSKNFNQPIAAPEARRLAPELLPATLRAQL